MSNFKMVIKLYVNGYEINDKEENVKMVMNDGQVFIGDIVNAPSLKWVLTGNLVPEWTPMAGEKAWFLYTGGEVELDVFDDTIDMIKHKNGMVFQTEAEAIAKREDLGWVCE